MQMKNVSENIKSLLRYAHDRRTSMYVAADERAIAISVPCFGKRNFPPVPMAKNDPLDVARTQCSIFFRFGRRPRFRTRERERQRTKTLWQSDQPLFSLCSDDVEIRLTKKLFVLSPYFVFVTSVHSIESLQMHSHCPFEYRFLSNFAAANFIRIGKSTIFPLRTPKNAQFSQKCVEKFCARWRSVGGFSDLLTFFLQIFRHNFPVLQIQFNSI